MSQTNAQLRAQDAPEYNVYAFPKNDNSPLSPKWQKVSATRNAKRAIKHAKLLNYQKKYERIEIQKTAFCKNRKKRVGKTFRTYRPTYLSWMDIVKNIGLKKD